MFPPQQGVTLNLEALSGICGSISIACWVVVFSPQIIENFRRQSAEGLSVVFLVVWLAGDVFNILGALLQGVLPTMIILAIYYTLADIVLLCQVFYYRGFTLSDETAAKTAAAGNRDQESARVNEHRPLLAGSPSPDSITPSPRPKAGPRRRSLSQLRRHLSLVDGTHLSPATPLHDTPKANEPPPAVQNMKPTSTLQVVVFNMFAILLVCAAGVFGWWLGIARKHHHPNLPDGGGSGGGGADEPADERQQDVLKFDVLGQIFGYFCAALYLGSRIPQLLLNYRRKSTEGVSLLFFLFACVGNLTYDMSIFAYSPICRYPAHCQPGEVMTLYGRYLLVNASWIAGSLGTLLLDMAIFVQFFLYNKSDEGEDEDWYFDDVDEVVDDRNVEEGDQITAVTTTTAPDDRGRGRSSSDSPIR